MTIDLAGTDDAKGGPVNCGEAQAISAARVAYKLLINPDNPPDGGAFRPLTVAVPRGLDAGRARTRRRASGTSRRSGS